ncbi:hypothetical protein MRX96_021812 [Rhipicephalus microplus]
MVLSLGGFEVHAGHKSSGDFRFHPIVDSSAKIQKERIRSANARSFVATPEPSRRSAPRTASFPVGADHAFLDAEPLLARPCTAPLQVRDSGTSRITSSSPDSVTTFRGLAPRSTCERCDAT